MPGGRSNTFIFEARILAVSCNPEGSIVAVIVVKEEDTFLELYDASTFTPTYYQRPYPLAVALMKTKTAPKNVILKWKPKSRTTLIVAADNYVTTCYHKGEHIMIQSKTATDENVISVTWSNNGSRLMAMGRDGKITIIITHPGLTSVCVLDKNQQVLSDFPMDVADETIRTSSFCLDMTTGQDENKSPHIQFLTVDGQIIVFSVECDSKKPALAKPEKHAPPQNGRLPYSMVNAPDDEIEELNSDTKVKLLKEKLAESERKHKETTLKLVTVESRVTARTLIENIEKKFKKTDATSHATFWQGNIFTTNAVITAACSKLLPSNKAYSLANLISEIYQDASENIHGYGAPNGVNIMEHHYTEEKRRLLNVLADAENVPFKVFTRE
uniref:ANAPC4_WD40 domain-containing protein n=1 Tax=Panagrellus redivivus TaxID=6233 RepID=A0A7E4UXU9_PANRE